MRPRGESAASAAPDAAAATTGRSVALGGIWNAASRILPQLYLLVISVAAARFLGPDGMGRQSFIAFVSLSVAMLLSGGLAQSLARHVGETLGQRQPERLRDLIRWAWRVEIAAGVLGGGALALVALGGADPRAAWLLAAVGALIGTVHTVPHAVLVGVQRWRQAALIGLATGSVGLPLTIGVLAAGGGITGMFAVEAAVAAAALIWTTRTSGRVLSGLAARAVADPPLRRATARYAAWASIGVILTFIVFRRSEFFLLAHYSEDSEIAIYSIAFAVVNALVLVPEALAGTALPAFATLFGAGATERIRSGYARALRLMSLVTLPVTALMLAAGPEALRVVYGDDYSGTEPVLRVMVLAFPIVPLMSISEAMLTGLGKIRAPLLIGGFAAAVNVGLALILIPRLDAVGAGLANAGAQLAVSVVTLAYCWRLMRGPRLGAGHLGRNLLVSAAAGGVAYALVSLLGGLPGVVLGAGAGSVVFLAGSATIGVLSADDAGWLAAAAGSRLGPRAGRACALLAGARGRGQYK